MFKLFAVFFLLFYHFACSQVPRSSKETVIDIENIKLSYQIITEGPTAQDDDISYQEREAERQGVTFENFLNRQLDILFQLTPERLQQYFKTLAEGVINLEVKSYDWGGQLNDYFNGLSKQDGRYIKKQVEGFKSELQNKPPNTAKLLAALNGYLGNKESDFNEYIEALEEYQKGSIQTIRKPTNRVVNNVIEAILSLPEHKQVALESILKKAAKENEIWSSNLHKVDPGLDTINSFSLDKYSSDALFSRSSRNKY